MLEDDSQLLAQFSEDLMSDRVSSKDVDDTVTVQQNLISISLNLMIEKKIP